MQDSGSVPSNACRLRNIGMRDYQENVTTIQTDTLTDRHTPEKVIRMCRYASQTKQKVLVSIKIRV